MIDGPPRSDLTLVVRRTIRASPERLFAAWTEPSHLQRWWGPAQATCPEAEIDLRVGGRYRIANAFADGRMVWIAGTFEAIEPPRRLVYTWRIEPGDDTVERVTVRFDAAVGATEMSIVHERIAGRARRDSHRAGWAGCLDGLAAYLAKDGA